MEKVKIFSEELSSLEDLSKPENTEPKKLNFVFSSDEAYELDAFLARDDSTVPSKENLTKLFEQLTTDSIVSLPNLLSFDKYILNKLLKSQRSYNILRASITGVKLLNSVYGYSVTDNALAETGKTFKILSKDKVLNGTVPQTTFPPDISQPFFYYRGGEDFILISPNNIPFNMDNVDNLFNSSNSGLKVVSAAETNCPAYDIENALLRLANICDKKKTPLKINSMLNSDLSDEHLRLTIASCLVAIRGFENNFIDLGISEKHSLGLIYNGFNSHLSAFRPIPKNDLGENII